MDSITFFLEQLEALYEFAEIGDPNAVDDPYFAELVAEYKAQDAALTRMHKRLSEEGFGMTLKHTSREWWAFILPDASCPGHYRYQVFGRDGFVGHFTYSTVMETLIEMVRAGFTQDACRNTLESVSSTKLWEIGSAKVELMTQLNSGAISQSYYEREVNSLNTMLETQDEAA